MLPPCATGRPDRSRERWRPPALFSYRLVRRTSVGCAFSGGRYAYQELLGNCRRMSSLALLASTRRRQGARPRLLGHKILPPRIVATTSSKDCEEPEPTLELAEESIPSRDIDSSIHRSDSVPGAKHALCAFDD